MKTYFFSLLNREKVRFRAFLAKLGKTISLRIDISLLGYVPASSVEAYKQAVGQYFKEILPLTETGVNLPNLDGMTISAKQGCIMISGLKDGTQVRLYAVDGKYIGESIATQGSASFYCQEPMVIAKVGNKTLKIAVK